MRIWKKILIISMATVILFTSMLAQPRKDDKAEAIWPFIISVGASLAFDALWSRIGFGAGSTATKDYPTVRDGVWSKMTAKDKANQVWYFKNYKPNPRKPGWGKIAIPLTIAMAIFGLAGDEGKDMSAPYVQTREKYEKSFNGNPYKFIAKHTPQSGFPDYSTVSPPKIFAPHIVDSLPSGSVTKRIVQFTKTDVEYQKAKDYFKVTIFFLLANDTIQSYFINVPADIYLEVANGSNMDYYENRYGEDFTPEQIAVDTGAYPEKVIEVQIPDPQIIHDEDALKKFLEDLKKNPNLVIPDPIDYAEPTTKPTEADWWKWLTTPLEELLRILKDLFDLIRDAWDQMLEWFSSLLSKLADLLGSLSQFFSDLFTQLGEWFQKLLDAIGGLGTTLWEWLQKLFDAIGGLGTTLWEWMQKLIDTIAGLGLDLWNWLGKIADGILSIPDLIITALTDLFVPKPNDIPDLWEPIKETARKKFNDPNDFKKLAPSIGSAGCPPDIYASVFGHRMKVVDVQLVCSQADWWKPIMAAFMWFLFGWWLFRKGNAIMARNGGIR